MKWPLLHTLPLLCSLAAAHAEVMTYPPTRHAEQEDDYHGVKIADPFRWLEDDQAPETKAWVEAENQTTFAYLETIPERAAIKARLTQLWNYERFGVPEQHGGRYFYQHNTGLQNQRVLYVADTLEAKPRVLLDPNALSPDGTVSLAGEALTDDGKLLAYGLSRAGSDWEEWRVRDVATGEDREDLLEWVKFSGAAWLKDGSGFYYSRYDPPGEGRQFTAKNEFQKLYFHRVGTKQEADVLAYERRDHANWGFQGVISDDGRYLVIHVSEGTDTRNRVFYRDLHEPEGKVIELLNDFDASYDFIANEGPVFLFKTDLASPRGRVVAIDTTQPQPPAWRAVVAERGDLLNAASLVGGRLICEYLHDAHSRIELLAWDGAALRATPWREAILPGLGSAQGFGGRREDTETFYSFTSFTVPGTIYRLDLRTGESAVFRAPAVAFDPADYETRQVFCPSKDGTKIPLFITHRRGLALDGRNPTLLTGYGGFNISLTPSFDVRKLVWMEMGGVFAMANLRGGGEYGNDWHLAGVKEKKQNVFDDFIGCAEWLVARQYTAPEKLAIAGGSNGGLLVGACLTQRPDLFAAALPAVGVLDMLRFHRFTIGWAWTSDYGSSDDPEEFKSLLAYSPLHHLAAGVRYPATLISTADHDDRVVPAHSFKFAARLQECQAPGGPPVLIRIETKAGHGGGKPMTKIIEETADEWGFLVRTLGLKLPPP